MYTSSKHTTLSQSVLINDYASAMTIYNNNSFIKIFPNGKIEVSGTMQYVARALFEHVLEEIKGGAIGLELNGTIRASCIRGKHYTLEWIGRGLHTDTIQPAPIFWNELKKEFDRLGRLKVFIMRHSITIRGVSMVISNRTLDVEDLGIWYDKIMENRDLKETATDIFQLISNIGKQPESTMICVEDLVIHLGTMEIDWMTTEPPPAFHILKQEFDRYKKLISFI